MPRKDQPGRAAPPPGGAPPGGIPTFPPGPGGLAGIPPNGVKPGTLIQFDYHNANIDNVLTMLSKVTGQTIISDPTLTGQVTIISPKEVTIDEAFKILQSVLAVRGFSAQSQGSVI